MRFDILTIFPEIFESFTRQALIARAQKKGIVTIQAHNLRRWTRDAHQSVDDRPYGGGAGMVLLVEPILRAVSQLRQKRKRCRVIAFSAKGKTFDQATARRYRRFDQLIMICGRYEGIDERALRYVADEEVSIGDYVLFGGEVPAMVVIESITRLLPGAIGKQTSLTDESFNAAPPVARAQLKQLLEYPHYTRPEAITIGGRVRRVPKMLLSGHHERIEAWRRAQAEKLTQKRRPDLLKES